MPKRTGGTSRSPGRESEGPVSLPDLSAFDLRTLRTSDDSTVADAVEWALRGPDRFRIFWAAEGGQGGDGGSKKPCGGREHSTGERHSVPERGARAPRDPANFPS